MADLHLHFLLPSLREHPALRGLAERLTAGAAARASAIDAAKPALLAALHGLVERPVLVVAARPGRARALAEELRVWSDRPERVLLFPARDGFPYERLPPDPATAAQRRAVLAALALHAADPPLLVVTSVRALLDRLMPPERLRAGTLELRVGARLRPERLLEALVALGYRRVELVEQPGQFARRGGIVDIYPASAPNEAGPADDEAPFALRVDFFGDEIDSLRRFDPATQRSVAAVEAYQLGAAHEVLPPLSAEAAAALRALDLAALRDDLAAAYARDRERLLAGDPVPLLDEYRAYLGTASLLDYLPAGGALVLDEPEQLAEAAATVARQAAEVEADLVARGEAPRGLWPALWGWEALAARWEAGSWARLALALDPDAPGLFAHPPSYGGRLRQLARELRGEAATRRVVVVSQQDARLRELFVEQGGPELPGGLSLLHGALQEGFVSEALGLALYTDRELFGWAKQPRALRPRAPTAARDLLVADLQPGELVVHLDHGIGRYRGLVRLATRAPLDGTTAWPSADGSGTVEREYLSIQYAEGDHLYVPIEQANRVTRYIGAGAAEPALTRLRSGDWLRAKQRARRAVREIARELLELYAAREVQPGHAFAPDTPWQAELEGSFPYVETPDQLTALAEIKADMERPRPMDRLLIGDVGYGKTELALRAAFKAVMDGKQVAMLVPTTVLAQQHYQTFRARLAAFPTRVELLSRFRSEREQREVLEGLRSGAVDIVIGTHRLIQKDVQFKDLGLVIIDEEQRFGVAHKERLKQLRREVDVLTLSATPIPRTLHMALVGVRDVSTLATAPEDRLPIRTFVAQYDEGLIRDAILRELERGGQVYFVHNRVRSIQVVAAQLQRLVPEARLAIAHGQMPEDALEQVMLAFSAGAYDVLVCSTIIESGLDLPNVNTIIVNQAHRFGLAQLYQLRGRVGRGANRAYAYFLYTRDGALTEAATARLRTIAEATELGAGFRIAMKDLEIRGAGNLLGAEQSGHISAVGFDLYCRLLAEAVESLRALRDGGRPVAAERLAADAMPPPGARVALPLPAYLPADYVPDEAQRLRLYQRLAEVRDFEALGAFFDELEDRFGPLPEPAANLLYLVRLRLAATAAGVQAIDADDEAITVRFAGAPPRLPADAAREIGTPVRYGSNQVRLPRGKGTEWIGPLRRLVDMLADAPRLAPAARR
jgi:transcription-repair coupling factor (superfamily II helicase)